MIAKLAQAVLKLILPDVTEHLLKVFKLDHLVAYMELENDADKGVKKLDMEMCMVKDQLKEMAKDIHPPKDSPITKEQVDEILGFMKKMKKTQDKFKIG